jgi:twitching motility protein PilI
MAQAPQSAFECLVSIDKRCREHAFELPKQEEHGTYWSGIGFVLGGQHFVAPMGEVSEVLHVPEYTKVPGAKSWVRGVANVRGTLLPIMDLQGFLYEKPNRNRRQRLMVVSKGDFVTSVIVDDVLGLQHFEEYERLEAMPEVDDVIRPFVQGAFGRNDRTWIIFSLHELAENANFVQVAV